MPSVLLHDQQYHNESITIQAICNIFYNAIFNQLLMQYIAKLYSGKLWLIGWQSPFCRYALWIWSLSVEQKKKKSIFLYKDQQEDLQNLPWYESIYNLIKTHYYAWVSPLS